MPRMLYAQVKRSPYPHARILRIDTSKAEALPGVRSVITGDCYTKRCGLYLEDKNFLAVGTAKYRGEAVAAVAAETPEIADEAVELIEVEYEQLPAVTNAVEGMKPDAPLIQARTCIPTRWPRSSIRCPTPTSLTIISCARGTSTRPSRHATSLRRIPTTSPTCSMCRWSPTAPWRSTIWTERLPSGVYPVPLRSAPGPVRRL